MENVLLHIAQLSTLFAAIFFGIHAWSGITSLYMRHLDRIPIDTYSLREIGRDAAKALIFAAIAFVFHYQTFFMAFDFLMCGFVIFQVVSLNSILKCLEY